MEKKYVSHALRETKRIVEDINVLKDPVWGRGLVAESLKMG